jgi:carboxylesterase type B
VLIGVGMFDLVPDGGRAPSVVHRGTQGYIKGDDGVHVFRGVPYATARRFKRSEPHPSWEGVKDCTKFGPTAVQGAVGPVAMRVAAPL